MKQKTFLFIFLIAFLIIPFSFISSVKTNPTYEDFTTYTEKDDNNHIDFTANHIDFKLY